MVDEVDSPVFRNQYKRPKMFKLPYKKSYGSILHIGKVSVGIHCCNLTKHYDDKTHFQETKKEISKLENKLTKLKQEHRSKTDKKQCILGCQIPLMLLYLYFNKYFNSEKTGFITGEYTGR